MNDVECITTLWQRDAMMPIPNFFSLIMFDVYALVIPSSFSLQKNHPKNELMNAHFFSKCELLLPASIFFQSHWEPPRKKGRCSFFNASKLIRIMNTDDFSYWRNVLKRSFQGMVHHSKGELSCLLDLKNYTRFGMAATPKQPPKKV